MKIQEYVDGEYIYISRSTGCKKSWGTFTSTRQELQERNEHIYQDNLSGIPLEHLTEKYFLSLKSIQRIVGRLKKENEQ